MGGDFNIVSGPFATGHRCECPSSAGEGGDQGPGICDPGSPRADVYAPAWSGFPFWAVPRNGVLWAGERGGTHRRASRRRPDQGPRCSGVRCVVAVFAVGGRALLRQGESEHPARRSRWRQRGSAGRQSQEAAGSVVAGCRGSDAHSWTRRGRAPAALSRIPQSTARPGGTSLGWRTPVLPEYPDRAPSDE
jgi:hypothetical protein